MEYRELLESAIRGTHDLAVETNHEAIFHGLQELVVARGRTEPDDIGEHLDAAELELRRAEEAVPRFEPGIERVVTDIDRCRQALTRAVDVHGQVAADPEVVQALEAAEAEIDELKRDQQPPLDPERHRLAFPGLTGD